MAPLSNKDLYWLAGLLEGEGSFGLTRCVVKGRTYEYPLIQLGMCDEDTIARVAKLYGAKYRRLKGSKPGDKDRFTTTLTNKRAASLMSLLCPIMSARRQARIREVLAHATTRAARPFGKRGSYR